MYHVKIFPGDAVVIHGTRIMADTTVTLTSDRPLQREPAPGLVDLPETRQRIPQLWPERGHRVPMSFRHDLRCPCGSAYVRRSATHHSCPACQRVWTNEEVIAITGAQGQPSDSQEEQA